MILTVDEETLSGLPDWAVAAIWAADEQIQKYAQDKGIDVEHCVSSARTKLHSRDALASLKMMGVTKEKLTLMLSAWSLMKAVAILEPRSDAHVKSFFVMLLLSVNLLPTSESTLASMGAEALHGKPGGSRDKRAAIQAAWATGKYSSRDICAEQESAALGMSFSSARKALRGMPDPS